MKLNIKKCSSCKEEKAFSEFNKTKKNKDGMSYNCRLCENEYRAKWREENRIKCRQYQKKYQDNNKEKCYFATKEWAIKNKDRMLELTYKWRAENPEKSKEIYTKQNRKRLLDPHKKINLYFSMAVSSSLKGRRSGKACEKRLGYKIADLKKHLESKFKSGMTWDNYGEWEVDHIIPISFFNFSEYSDKQFKQCWNIENIQPLWKSENRIKGNKITSQALTIMENVL